MRIEEHDHRFMRYFGVKTLSETPFSPSLMEAGYGATGLGMARTAENGCQIASYDKCYSAGPRWEIAAPQLMS